MLSLKEHQKLYLENKTETQLTMHILALKKEMNRLKRMIERESIVEFHSSPKETAARIRKLRLYLRDTYVALEKKGGSFRHSETERTAIAFQQNIPFIQRIDYSIGGYFGGFDKYSALIEEEQVVITFDSLLERMPDSDYTRVSTNDDQYIVDKKEFLKTIEFLHMAEWRESYLAEDYGYTIRDGTSWGVQVYYTNDIEKVEFGGVNAFPYNFGDFHKLFDR